MAGYGASRGGMQIIGGFWVYAGILEYLQHFSPGRHPSIADFAGSALGALCGGLVSSSAEIPLAVSAVASRSRLKTRFISNSHSPARDTPAKASRRGSRGRSGVFGNQPTCTPSRGSCLKRATIAGRRRIVSAGSGSRPMAAMNPAVLAERMAARNLGPGMLVADVSENPSGPASLEKSIWSTSPACVVRCLTLRRRRCRAGQSGLPIPKSANRNRPAPSAEKFPKKRGRQISYLENRFRGGELLR
jgi:hypothetical protein